MSTASNNDKISELQSAVASLTASVAALTAEVGRLSGKSFQHQTMKTSIPLLPMQQSQPRAYTQESGRRPYREMRNQLHAPAATAATAATTEVHRTVALADILSTDEEVIFFVNTGANSNGASTQTTTTATFNGTDLVVSSSETIPSLVGLQTQKPGEILYKFIEELKNANHIKRTFSVAPWKLCYVVRDGQRITLDELRKRLPSQ